MTARPSPEQIAEAAATVRDWKSEIEAFLADAPYAPYVPAVPAGPMVEWGTVAWARLALLLVAAAPAQESER